MKLDTYLSQLIKINSEWIKDLNTRLEIIKLLGANTGWELFDTDLGNNFLDIIRKESNKSKWDYVKVKVALSCLTLCDPVNCTVYLYKYVASQVTLVVRNPLANADVRDMGLISGSGRSPGGGDSTPLQYSCLENPMDRRDWWAIAHRAAKSRTQLK